VRLPPGRLRPGASAAGVQVAAITATCTPDKVGHQCRQTIVVALRPVVFDGDVAALDVTSFVEAFLERRNALCARRAAIEESDERHVGLLRAPRAATRPPRRRAVR
jgi:hypothetical protein